MRLFYLVYGIEWRFYLTNRLQINLLRRNIKSLSKKRKIFQTSQIRIITEKSHSFYFINLANMIIMLIDIVYYEFYMQIR